MKILLLTAFVALSWADVSHVLNQQHQSGYQYHNLAPENSPLSSYGVPQASVLGNGLQSVPYQSLGSGSNSQLSLPSVSGPAVSFTGFSNPAPSGVAIQSYSGFPNPAGLSSFQVSTPAPNVDLSRFQVSSPAPSVDLSSFQVSSPSPSADFSGFQVSTPSSVPSVNLVQYSQPSSSYQFLSRLSQTGGLSSLNGIQFGSDASLNSGTSFGLSSGSGLGGDISGSSFVGKTSGGSLSDAFGVGIDATASAGAAGPSQEAEVSKHLYFFAAPEDEEEQVQAKIDLPAVPPKKTYKIIFIKAPTYSNRASITIPAPPQNEEKTLVYVLVKKPEGHPNVRFQEATPAQPSKPEVFFIKYKTQKEAEAAVAEIQSKHGATGHVIANLPAGTQSVQSESGISGISVSSTPSAVSFGASDVGSVSRSGFASSIIPGNGEIGESGLSLDALGATSFGSSTPSSVNFENRISIQETQLPVVSQNPVQVGAGEAGLKFTFGQGGISPTPVTFGQHSVDSFKVFGGGIAPSQSPSIDTGSSIEVVSVGDNIESKSIIGEGSDVEKEEPNVVVSSSSSEEGSPSVEISSSGESGSEETSAINVSAINSVSEGFDDGHVSQNVIQERIGVSSGNDNTQDSEAAGFSQYGPPNF